MRTIFRSRCIKHAPLLSRPPRCHLTARRITTSAALPAQVQQIEIPKLLISPGSPHHNSLPSFLEYANRVNLAPSKTYYVGTHYEYTTALALLRLGFSLLRIGKKYDGGIDLIGHWILPQLREPQPVIVQCKARNFTCAPRHVRELEGAFHGIPADWRKKDVLGLLVTTQKATKGVLDALGASRRPMGFMKILKDGTIEQFVWNRAAGERGLEGVGVTIRHTPRILLPESEIEEQGEEGADWHMKEKGRRVKNKFKDAGTKKDIQLTWMGSPIFPDREGIDEETVRLMSQITDDNEVEVVKKTTKRKMATKVGTKETTAKGTKVKKTAVEKTPARRATSKKATVQEAVNGLVKRGRGRPLGSKSKMTLATETSRPRGRPKGSKNKIADTVT